MSPFLFVLAMEYLSRILDEAYNKGLIEGFCLQQNGLHVSHLLFVDDILFFSRVDELELQNLHLLLKSFEIAKGLSINLMK